MNDNTKSSRKKEYTIAVLDGDGIGPEIMAEAVKALQAVATRSGIGFRIQPGAFGAAAYFSDGHPFPEATQKLCDSADAILKGPIGLSHAESAKIPPEMLPERGALLPLRQRYDTFANFRPVSLPKSLAHFSPLRAEVIGDGIDFIIIRELVGGLYFGHKERGIDEQGRRFVRESLDYDEAQIRRIAKIGFETAQGRGKVLHNIHKSNVLKSSVLWNEVVDEMAQDYPEVTVEHVLVDAAATYLCLDPGRFDVLLTENMFGDILSDQGGGILGSLGLMPSACIGPEKAYYEPSHGSAPDIAGQGAANPYSMIGSVAMMLEMSFGLKEESQRLWQAMQAVLAAGYLTADLAKPAVLSAKKTAVKTPTPPQLIDTATFGDKVVEHLAGMAT